MNESAHPTHLTYQAHPTCPARQTYPAHQAYLWQNKHSPTILGLTLRTP
jgi:hypothetical protein